MTYYYFMLTLCDFVVTQYDFIVTLSRTIVDPNDDDFLPNLMEEFPHLYLAPETIKKMWDDHQQQSGAVRRLLEDDRRKQSKAKATVLHIVSLTVSETSRSFRCRN